MKKSPLQLEWVVYPNASYEYIEDATDMDGPVAVDVNAEVIWSIDGQHTASVAIRSVDDPGSPYRFNVMAAALFTFDLEVAMKYYRPDRPAAIAPIIAVNICRILFSGAREQIAMMTARGPSGPVTIEGVVIEPLDIKVSSAAEPLKILRDVFKVPEEVIKEIEVRASQLSAKGGARKKEAKKR